VGGRGEGGLSISIAFSKVKLTAGKSILAIHTVDQQFIFLFVSISRTLNEKRELFSDSKKCIFCGGGIYDTTKQ
jgi:hypothetical protein